MTDARLNALSNKLLRETDRRRAFDKYMSVDAEIAWELFHEVQRLKACQRFAEKVLARTRQPLILAGSEAEAAKKAIDTAPDGG